MPDLLFEIGCEEIPAGFLAAALPQLERLAQEELADRKLPFERLEVLGSPRRLALLVFGLAERQPDVDEILVGPPVSAGEKAAHGFARKYGVGPSALSEQETEKGRRFVVRRQMHGRDARELAPALLATLLGKLSWPKSMRWASHKETFVRPVHWMVALYDGEPVAVEFAGVRAGRESRGHRFLSPEPFPIQSAASYRDELRQRHVLVDPAERRRRIEEELCRIERETGLSVRKDAALLDEVTNLVELPLAIAGSFDERFLEVPEPVIVSAMRSHQRYFAMTGEGGRLANRFVTIAGTPARDPQVVVRGNERVLAARLADARFFLDEDRKVPLGERVGRLDGIVWIRKLGTMGAKVGRIGKVAAELAGELGVPRDKVLRAAALAKADLTTHLVAEFPELQGTIGSAYARAAGEDSEVADAIAEHYQPRGAQDAPAKGRVGAVLAIADRIDTLVGCFAAGLAPTGSADPLGLRRAALGLLETVLAHGWHVSLARLGVVAAAELEALLPGGQIGRGEESPVPVERSSPGPLPPLAAAGAVHDFLRGRLRGIFAEHAPADLAEAVLAASADDPVDALARLRALAALRGREGFEPLAIAIKRVGNILKSEERPAEAIDPGLLREPAEKSLAEVAMAIERRVRPLFAAHDYDEALRVLTELKQPVDALFEKVFVMDKDAAVRKNRLALLASINRMFLSVADFRQLDIG